MRPFGVALVLLLVVVIAAPARSDAKQPGIPIEASR
jgi:hypothetical protein